MRIELNRIWWRPPSSKLIFHSIKHQTSKIIISYHHHHLGWLTEWLTDQIDYLTFIIYDLYFCFVSFRLFWWEKKVSLVCFSNFSSSNLLNVYFFHWPVNTHTHTRRLPVNFFSFLKKKIRKVIDHLYLESIFFLFDQRKLMSMIIILIIEKNKIKVMIVEENQWSSSSWSSS